MRETQNGRIRGTSVALDASARRLRQVMPPAELQLWNELRGQKLDGLKFRRQHPLGSFVLDFACPSRLLGVEVDGSVHRTQTAQDEARSGILSEFGWQILRFSNREVENSLLSVLEAIRVAAQQRPIAPGQLELSK